MEGEKNILVTLPVKEEDKTYLEEIALKSGKVCNFDYIENEKVTRSAVEKANAILGNVDPGILKYAENLEWIQLFSAGADPYTSKGILREGTVLTNVSGAYGLAVSEHMIAMVFSLIRRFPQYSRNQFEHQWRAAGNIISVEDSTVLVLGLGDIGGSFARKMKALGAYVIGIKRTNGPSPDYLDEQHTIEELDEFLPKSDIVAMAIPGGNATYHLMDEHRLELMKDGAYLVNVGRGNSIDFKGLHKVLMDGHLGGCALDVTEPEPLPADDPLWDMDNVLITPHVAGGFYLPQTCEKIVMIMGENLDAWLNQKELHHRVNLAAGY